MNRGRSGFRSLSRSYQRAGPAEENEVQSAGPLGVTPPGREQSSVRPTQCREVSRPMPRPAKGDAGGTEVYCREPELLPFQGEGLE